MKNTLLVCANVTLAVLLAAAFAQPAPAQAMETLSVKMEHSFLAGGHEMPAGAYTITLLGNTNSSPVLMFTSDTGFRATMIANRVETPLNAGASLVLDRRGDQYWLKRVNVRNAPYGYELLSAAHEESEN
jgi:hypothetical protein